MRPDEYRAVLDGAMPALDAARAKVARANAAWLDAKASGDPARYEAAWAASEAASDAYEAAVRRFHALAKSLVPLVAWEEARDAAA